MSKSKHTPGPWSDEDGNAITAAGGRIGIACIERFPTEDFWCGIERFPAEDECKANVRLMAAAPELLAALQAMVGYQESTDLDDEDAGGEYGDGKRAMIAARAVLAKLSPPESK